MRKMMNPLVTAAGLAVMVLVSTNAFAQAAGIKVSPHVKITGPDAPKVELMAQGVVGDQVAREVRRSLADVARELVGIGDQGGSRDFRVEQRDRETKTLSIGSSGSLELKNIAGDITVRVGSGRDATVEILRVSRGRTDADAKLGLTEVTVDVTQRSNRASVTTRYPNSRNERPAYAVSVSYTVQAPPGTSLTIGTVSGDVRVDGIKGETTASGVSSDIEVSGAGRVPSVKTVSGDITLRDIDGDGAMSVETLSGDITLQGVKARRLSADVVSGDITARDVDAPSAELKGISGDIDYTGPLAQGGRYTFQSHSGSVKLTATGSTGFDVEARTFSGDINTQSGITLSRTGSGRSAMRGTVGDGGADVVITTFSGDVTIGRRTGGR